MVKVGILGVGTVGESVAKILLENADILEARAGKKIVPVLGAVRDLSKDRQVEIPLTDDPMAVIESADVDIVVELMGGVEEPYRLVRKALEAGKPVVTANKALLAYHRYELQEIAGETPLFYEASVAGGIPIIGALRNGLSANHIESIKGIMNGTCNFMLTKMIKEGADYEAVLKEAQELGYAEADPTFDVGGYDAAHKLLILGSIAYGIDAKPEEIIIEGIEKITATDVEFAQEFGYEIKLLGIAKKVEAGVEMRVHATMIPAESMIAKVDGVMNAVSVVGDRVGETMFYGPGAGGDATASAVIADIVEIVRGNSGPMLGYKKGLESGLPLVAPEAISSQYYLKLKVLDRPGVLAQVTSTLGEFGISIESMLQKPSRYADRVRLLFTTHRCEERKMNEAIAALKSLEVVDEQVTMIRIEK
ncbi:homoserine dehydrogenase [Nitratifractor sp.]|uniref:homoserine dehydrogenase n=1 Tax=Nitratifractor sp. TaxID=2268144 RepID=UPI0025DFD1B7|nr:homoserine dehydrogenase [Nitratifractor sp.]